MTFEPHLHFIFLNISTGCSDQIDLRTQLKYQLPSPVMIKWLWYSQQNPSVLIQPN